MASPTAIALGDAFVRIAGDTSSFEGALRTSEQRFNNFASSIGSLGQKLLGGGLLSGAALGIAARDFAQLDDNLRAVQGITRATSVEFDKLESTVRNLGATTSFTAVEVGGAAKELARGGQEIEQINQTLESVLNLARGTGSDLNFAGAAVVRTLGQFQLEATEAGRVVDVLASAANSGTFSLDDLAESMKFLGPIAKTLNETVETTGAAFAVLANNGLRGGIAGRQLRRVLFELSDEAKQLKIANLFDIDVTDIRGNIRPLVDLVGEIGGELKKLSTGRQTTLLDQIFGEGAAAFAGLSAGAEDFRNLAADLNAVEGNAKDLAELIDGGLGGAFRIAVSAVRDFSIEVGKAISGRLIEWLQAIKVAAKRARDWVAANQELLVSILKVTAGIIGAGGLLVGTAALIGTVTAVYGVFKSLILVLASVSIPMGFLTGPLGFIALAAGILGVVGVSSQLVEGMEKVKDAFSTAFADASAAIGQTEEPIQRLLKQLTELSGKEFLSAQEFTKAQLLIEKLEKKVGDLGVTFDQNNNRVEGLGEGTELGSTRVGINRLEEQIAPAKEKMEELAATIRDLNETAAASGAEELDKLLSATDEFDELARKVRLLQGALADLREEEARIGEKEATKVVARELVRGFGEELKTSVTNVGDLLKSVLDEAKGRTLKAGFNPLTGSQASFFDQIGTQFANVRDAASEGRLVDAAAGVSSAFGFLENIATGTAFALKETAAQARAAKLAEDQKELDKDARALARSIRSDALKSIGAFGGQDLRNKITSQTIDIAARQLSEQEESNTLLNGIKGVLARQRGIPVGGN